LEVDFGRPTFTLAYVQCGIDSLCCITAAELMLLLLAQGV